MVVFWFYYLIIYIIYIYIYLFFGVCVCGCAQTFLCFCVGPRRARLVDAWYGRVTRAQKGARLVSVRCGMSGVAR